MTKKYNSPMLNVVSIKESDIIATSDLGKGAQWKTGDAILAPERNFEWYGE